MKNYSWLIKTVCLNFGLIYCLAGSQAQIVTVPVVTQNRALVLQTDKENRLRTVYFGESLINSPEYPPISGLYHFDETGDGIYNSAYTPAGTWNLTEPAIQIRHADGNTSLELKYVSHKQEIIDDNVTQTSITLKDPVYPFQVTLFYKAGPRSSSRASPTRLTNCGGCSTIKRSRSRRSSVFWRRARPIFWPPSARSSSSPTVFSRKPRWSPACARSATRKSPIFSRDARRS